MCVCKLLVPGYMLSPLWWVDDEVAHLLVCSRGHGRHLLVTVLRHTNTKIYKTTCWALMSNLTRVVLTLSPPPCIGSFPFPPFMCAIRFNYVTHADGSLQVRAEDCRLCLATWCPCAKRLPVFASRVLFLSAGENELVPPPSHRRRFIKC